MKEQTPDHKPLVVITGASSGIGKATAQAFAAQGHALLLLARRKERLDELNLPNTLTAKADVTDREAIEKAIKEAEAKFGPVDLLVNNAGVMLLSEFTEQDPQEWSQMIAVNVQGLLNATHAVAKSMKERRQGTILNISSVAGIRPFPNHVVYTGTKFAVSGLSENLRQELAPHNVRVITIEPGAVETELLSHTSDQQVIDDYQSWKKSIGGAIAAQDIANVILYAYNQPQNVCIREVVIAATGQEA